MSRPYLSAPIEASASGDTVLIPAVAGKAVEIYGYLIVAAAAVSVKLKSGTTSLTGAMPIASAGNGLTDSGVEESLLTGLAGQGLTINLSGAVAVGGYVKYRLIP